MDIKNCTYTGEEIPILGTTTVNVTESNTVFENTQLRIVKGDGPNLLGRDWLEVIKLDWGKVHRLSLSQVLKSNHSVFGEGLGKLEGTTAKIYVDENAKPRYFKPRPVPYSIRGKIESELERLEKQGIIEPVQFSEWAAPIVPIVKSDGSLRICGDYKVTVNQVSKLDNYPIPKVEDLYTVITGGEKFTKLDLSQAYNQICLDEESKKYTTINTHKGLFRYSRLPFGISSGPGICQRVMENLLQGIPMVIVRVDDILISGKNDVEHIDNVAEVLDRISKAQLKLKLSKCVFMEKQVTYMGHEVDKEGIHPCQDKVNDIKNAPAPKNVTQLKSFLGMLNYYHKFLPKLSTMLAPLHGLLKQGTPWTWNTNHNKAFEMSKELLVI